jgi:hypothetical protein
MPIALLDPARCVLAPDAVVRVQSESVLMQVQRRYAALRTRRGDDEPERRWTPRIPRTRPSRRAGGHDGAGVAAMRMTFPARHVWIERLMSLGSLLVLALAIVVLDDRVRERASLFLAGDRASVDLATLLARGGDVLRVASRFAHDQGMEHAPLVLFAVAATALVAFMLRT